ncbi:MAG: hypothetical protein Q3X39_04665 [Gemmiger sp.]|jgi:hypothetical protein|uniref:hypothetical protein n=1 Tax=Gemmiger TaxID=204475 RepID=UPI002849FF37|nr:hypothetical protein [Gemmiger sp.]MDR3941620.1 hypothetical protein [Gemmiger sp.]
MPNPEFAFTLADAVTWILSVCGAIAGIGAAIAVLVKFNTFLKKPNHEQDVKIEAMEEKITKMSGEVDAIKDLLASKDSQYMDLFKRDKARLDAQENSMNMLLRANFALLGHALNGNNVEQMQSAFNDIQEYLFNR